MMDYEWTPEAEDIFGKFFNLHRAKLCPQGADPDEVHENIRQHIHEEAASSGAKLITAERLNRTLIDLVPESEGESATSLTPSSTELPQAAISNLSIGFLLFGVILPGITILVELIGHPSANILFDPMPTLWHTLLVSLVPITNFLIYRSSHRTITYRPRTLSILCGASLVISLYYATLYAPTSLFAAFGIIYFGLGFIPLTALIAFCVTVRAGFKLRSISRAAKPSMKFQHALVAGIALGVSALLILEAPKYFTRITLVRAVSSDSEIQKKAIQQLRSLGSRDTLLRTCYESSRIWSTSGTLDTAGWFMAYFKFETVEKAAARRAYFQVTGVPFNQVKPPSISSKNGRRFLDGFSFDSDQGGDAVGLRLAHLHLQSSRIDSHIDPSSALAYTEWTLIFNNMSQRDAEARFQAMLPPDGVVSRLTLWVDGEPQEAAFAATQKVKAAYKNIVRVQRRDPVLVTSTGPDRVLVQCFPVPPQGGEIKIRLGITSPLVPRTDATGTGTAWMPRIIERNFKIPHGFSHALWVQSPDELSTTLDELGNEIDGGDKAHALSGTITNDQLNAPATRITASGITPSKPVWTNDPFNPGTRIVRQPAPAEAEPHRHLVIALDTSTGMQEGWEKTKSTITTFAKNFPVTLVLADDEITTHRGSSEIARALGSLKAGGGKDNATALVEALAAARQAEDSAVVWIHAAQPVLLADGERIAQTLERSFARRPIYSFAKQHGPDLVTAAIHRLADMHAAPRDVTLASFLKQLSTSGAPSPHAYKYAQLTGDDPLPEGAEKVWDHLARYRVFTETLEQYHRRDSHGIAPAAAARAARYQLVTPFSGAVVLETQRDFNNAGLKQIDPSSAPSVPRIPEPGSTSLLLLALASLALRRRR